MGSFVDDPLSTAHVWFRCCPMARSFTLPEHAKKMNSLQCIPDVQLLAGHELAIDAFAARNLLLRLQDQCRSTSRRYFWPHQPACVYTEFVEILSLTDRAKFFPCSNNRRISHNRVTMRIALAVVGPVLP